MGHAFSLMFTMLKIRVNAILRYEFVSKQLKLQSYKKQFGRQNVQVNYSVRVFHNSFGNLDKQQTVDILDNELHYLIKSW